MFSRNNSRMGGRGLGGVGGRYCQQQERRKQKAGLVLEPRVNNPLYLKEVSLL